MSDMAAITLNEDNYDPNQGVQWIDDGDKALHVEFYKHPVDGQDHVRIKIPGDNKTEPDEIAWLPTITRCASSVSGACTLGNWKSSPVSAASKPFHGLTPAWCGT